MTIAANNSTGPLRLDQPDTMFIVVDGGATLFAVGGDGLSPRRYLGTIEGIGLLFGSEPSLLGDEAIVAVPRIDGAVASLPMPTGGDGEDGAGGEPPPALFVDGLAAWIGAIGSGVAEQVVPKPRPDRLVRGGAALALDAGQIVAAAGALVWIDLGEAEAELCGIEPVAGLVPLPPGAWLVLAGPATIAVHDWADGFAASGWVAAVTRFNAAITEILPIVRGLADADELNRVRAQEEIERQDRRRAATAFAALIETRPPATRVATAEGLIDIVRLVADGEGLSVRRPVKAARAQQDELPTLDEIARASGFRTQPVPLGEGWWMQDQGALVARLADGGAAALLRGPRGYELIDETGARRRVDADVAADVAPLAHALLPGYAPGPITLAKLMRMNGRGGGRDTVAFAVALVAGALLGQALPRATGFVFAMLVPAGMSGAIVQVAAGVIMAGIAALLFQIALGVSRQRVDARATSRAYAALWDRVLLLPLPYLSARAPADLAAQAGAVVSAQIGIRQLAMLGAATGGAMVSALALILARQPALGLIAFAFVFVELALAAFAGWGQARAEQSQEQLDGNSDAALFDMISGLSKLRAAGAESRAMLRWSERFVAIRRVRSDTLRITNLYESFHGGFAIVAAAAMFATIALFESGAASGRGIAISDVMVVTSAFGLMITMIAQLVRALLALWLMKPTWSYAKRLLDEPAESLAERIDPGPLRGALDISDLAFRYAHDRPPVLAGLSFAIQPGQFVAIVGPSGSGKSTLIRLILGLLEPAAGAIYVDGHNVGALHPEAYRRQVGVVLQDMRLPPGSIGDIVGGGDAEEAEIWRALADAAIEAEVRAMPMGLHTMITDGGNTLSGGQLQRLALARIFLQQPSLLLLDEATSALDATTQAAAMRSVLALPCTRLVIAHRISTIRDADLILVLKGGRIVEAGRYDELVGAEGAFAELVDDSAG